MFDMAVEAHALQGRVTEVANALAPLNRQMAALAKTSPAAPTCRPT